MFNTTRIVVIRRRNQMNENWKILDPENKMYYIDLGGIWRMNDPEDKLAGSVEIIHSLRYLGLEDGLEIYVREQEEIEPIYFCHVINKPNEVYVWDFSDNAIKMFTDKEQVELKEIRDSFNKIRAQLDGGDTIDQIAERNNMTAQEVVDILKEALFIDFK